jgi:flagellar protein FlgJ
MTASAIHTDLLGLDRLRQVSADKDNSREAIREVANQFESMFLQMLLKSMRDASPGDGLFDSDSSGQYRDMLDSRMALELSANRPFGIAEAIERQLATRTTAADQGFLDSPDLLLGLQLSAYRRSDSAETAARPLVADTTVTQRGSQLENVPANPHEFIQRILPEATRTAHELGIDLRAILAQAALETGWGRAVLRHPDGRDSHNLFGIKAGADWQGERVQHLTTEYEDGQLVRRHASFRAYPSYSDAFADYQKLLTGDRYRTGLENIEDIRDFGKALRSAGYATDPRYGDKIRAIMGSERLGNAMTATAG